MMMMKAQQSYPPRELEHCTWSESDYMWQVYHQITISAIPRPWSLTVPMATKRLARNILVFSYSKSDYTQWSDGQTTISASLHPSPLTFQWGTWPWPRPLKGSSHFIHKYLPRSNYKSHLKCLSSRRRPTIYKVSYMTLTTPVKGQLIFLWQLLPRSTQLETLRRLAWSTVDYFADRPTDRQNHGTTKGHTYVEPKNSTCPWVDTRHGSPVKHQQHYYYTCCTTNGYHWDNIWRPENAAIGISLTVTPNGKQYTSWTLWKKWPWP